MSSEIRVNTIAHSGGTSALTIANNGSITPSVTSQSAQSFRLSQNITGSNNVYVGNYTAKCMCSGSNNIALGHLTMQCVSSGSCNIALGKHAGCAITTGSNNVLMGFNAGPKITTGNGNTFLGGGAGKYTDSSNYSVFIGCTAGHNAEGDHVIAVGFYAGHGGGTTVQAWGTRKDCKGNKGIIQRSEVQDYR